LLRTILVSCQCPPIHLRFPWFLFYISSISYFDVNPNHTRPHFYFSFSYQLARSAFKSHLILCYQLVMKLISPKINEQITNRPCRVSVRQFLSIPFHKLNVSLLPVLALGYIVLHRNHVSLPPLFVSFSVQSHIFSDVVSQVRLASA